MGGVINKKKKKRDMAYTHTISIPLISGQQYTISGKDSVADTNDETTLTVSSSSCSVSLDLTKEKTITSVVCDSVTLTYNDNTLSTSTTSLIPTCLYSLIVSYSYGADETVTSGATLSWSVDDTNSYFTIDSSTGEVTAGSSTNYSKDSATVTVTLSYSGYSGTISGNTATCDVYREAATDHVTNVSFSNVSLIYSTDTLSSSVTSLSPTLSYTITLTYASGKTSGVTSGATVTYSLSDTTYMSINSSTGVVSYGSTIITSKGTATVTASLSYENDDITESGSAAYTVYASVLTATLRIASNIYPDDGLTYRLTWDGTSMTLLQTSYITSGDTYDTITSEATYGCFFNPSAISSGVAVTALFSAYGYDVEDSSYCKTVNVDSITTITAELTEAETYTSKAYVYVTATSPTSQSAALSVTYSGSGTLSYTYYDGSSSSTYTSDATVTVNSSGNCYFTISGFGSSEEVSGTVTFSASGYSDGTEFFSNLGADKTESLTSTLSLTLTKYYTLSIPYISIYLADAVAITNVYCTDASFNGEETITKSTSIWKSDDASNYGGTYEREDVLNSIGTYSVTQGSGDTVTVSLTLSVTGKTESDASFTLDSLFASYYWDGSSNKILTITINASTASEITVQLS